LPKEFKKLTRASVVPWNYMRKRGYSEDDIHWLSKHYHLLFSRSGMWRHRIVLPVPDPEGEILCWTGRSWLKDKEPRYLTLTTDEDLARSKGYKPAIKPLPQLLLGLDVLWSCPNPDVLVVCEGPFDALRISVSGHAAGVWGTCLFGLHITSEQVELISALATRFRRIYLLVDTDARMRAFSIRQTASTVRMRPAELPRGVKDPGDLTPNQARELCATL
jgi:hypothetical protein